MQATWMYLKHFLVVSLVLLAIGFAVIVSQKGNIGFGTDDLAFKVGQEGPHIFYIHEQLQALYIRGGREQGFYTETHEFDAAQSPSLPVTVTADGSSFEVQVQQSHSTPPAVYVDDADILAISDLEGNYLAFRDFLIAHGVIDTGLNWTFGNGHLVLLGDFVDRGSSTTQLLWLVYKLEQDAEEKGGRVHFIIGNHEIKNMQGNFRSAAHRYQPIAGILGKQQYELFGPDAVIGRWLESKNTVEKINGYLFTHGGLHPGIADLGLSIDDINQLVRNDYRQFYYPSPEQSDAQRLLTSNKTGPAWYRGYFKDEVAQGQIDHLMASFEAQAIIVGHTLQFSVNQVYDGKVIGIDVKHPEDFSASFPIKRSEGLLVSKGKRYRLLDDGERIVL